MHHQSYFLSDLERVDHDEFRITLSESVGYIVLPLGTRGIYVEGNMVNLSPMILINIYWIPGKIDHAYIDANFSLDEIKRYTDIFKEFHDIFAWSY